MEDTGQNNFKELLNLHEKMCHEAQELMKKKNTDYTGDNPDKFVNFRGGRDFDIPDYVSILIRMREKLVRIHNVIKTGENTVEDETVYDTCLDLINFPILLMGMLLHDEGKEVPRQTFNIRDTDFNTATGLPLTPNGDDVTLQFDSGTLIPEITDNDAKIGNLSMKITKLIDKLS